MKIAIRPATPADVPQIHAMADRIWHAYYPSIVTVEQIDYMMEKMNSPASLTRQMEEGYRFFIVEKDQSPVGYLAVVPRGSGEYFLSKFYMGMREQGKGIGKEVFRLMLSEFPDLRTMRLQVNRRNFKAINFYFRVGFTIEDAKDFDIGNGFSMDDFVMVLKKSDT